MYDMTSYRAHLRRGFLAAVVFLRRRPTRVRGATVLHDNGSDVDTFACTEVHNDSQLMIMQVMAVLPACHTHAVGQAVTLVESA
jgi:hypothetical protein